MSTALEQLVAEAQRVLQPGREVSLEVRLPALDLAALSASLPDQPMVLWAPPGGPITLGLGATLLLRGHGAQRFAMLRDGAAELPQSTELFCGFAFTPGGGGGFGDALALLPRFVFRSDGDRTIVRATIDDLAIEQLAALRAEPEDASPTVALAEDDQEAARFVGAVEEARAAIRRGELDKVVLHRQTRLPHAGRTPAQTIAALLVAQPDATTYAFRIDGETFLGATPERLVRREGRTLRADVLAGSAPRDTQPAQLLESDKDRGEHELTRAAIADVLRPLCSRYDELGPRIRTLPHLHHLHTAIEGTLAAPRHVLDLVHALHPTPAVGGAPRKEALAFLEAHEHLQRGWYAAPIGWFRPDGDGDFAVALRCALVTAERVTLYAGAGIVRNSEPERELDETSTKRRAIAAALGLEIA